MGYSFFEILILIFKKISTRYVLVAGIPFVIFYVIFRKQEILKKIQHDFPQRKDYAREIFYSVSSMVIFTFVVWVVLFSPLTNYTLIYRDFSDYPRWYYFLSFPMIFVLHDTWFYWTHRLMHHRRLFRYFHLMHHKSTNPSPWAAYSFHPLEGIIEAGVLLLIAFVIPVHVTSFGIFFLMSVIYNVYGHLGYELFPKGTQKHWLGKWLNTSVNHNMHHKNFIGNYGLYFTFWDRLMGTTQAGYYDEFVKVTNQITIPPNVERVNSIE